MISSHIFTSLDQDAFIEYSLKLLPKLLQSIKPSTLSINFIWFLEFEMLFMPRESFNWKCLKCKLINFCIICSFLVRWSVEFTVRNIRPFSP